MIRQTSIALAALSCFAVSTSFAAEPAVLNVSVSGVPQNAQKVTLLVYNNEQNMTKAQSSKMIAKPRQQWNQQHSEHDATPAGGGATFKLDQLPAGEYAAMIFCDINGNDRLDTNFLGFPAEPIGMSGGAPQPNGGKPPRQKPSWNSMKFSVQPGENELAIKAFKLPF